MPQGYVTKECNASHQSLSPGLLEYERDPTPGDHDGPHHPQHQHLQGGQGQDQEARELHNQPQVGEIVKYFNARVAMN